MQCNVASKNIFYQNPLLRLAIPLMAGIATGWVCDVEALHIFAVFILSVVLLPFCLMHSAPKWLFGVGVMMFMFSTGLFVESRQAYEKSLQWSSEKNSYTARLVEVPCVRGSDVKVLAELFADTLCSINSERRKGIVYLHFQRSVETESLSAGDLLELETMVYPPCNQGNPAEFNIERFYYIKDISGTAFVYDEAWEHIPTTKKGIKIRALELRAGAVALYERLGFEKENMALLSALTLGEKRDFPQELKESYSIAGASHILAMSGLHLGILYMIITALLPLRRRNFVFRLLREVVVIAVLWGFAFVAGLSPSVVRSATLFTLMSSGRLLSRDVSPISSLAFAAIAMLLFSPHLLFDVSFQLSFAAVFAILLLAPPLQDLLGVYERGPLYAYIVNLLILSLVSQLGTMPLVWYYFGMFPVYFLLTNLFVVPLAFAIMILVLLVWLLTPIPFLQHCVAWLLDIVAGLMNMGVQSVAELPSASYSLPPLGIMGIMCVVLFITLFSLGVIQRRWWLVAIASCSTLPLIVLLLLFDKSATDGNYMVIYNNRKNPLVHLVYDGGENYLVSTVPQRDAEYVYVSAPFVKQESLSSPQWVEQECNDSVVQYSDGLFMFDGVAVRLLDNAHWRENEYVKPVDILVLCRGFLGPISELVEVYPAACVVLDGSLYRHSRERIKRECALLGIEAVDISQSGAMKVVVSGENFDLVPMRDK